MGFFSSIGKAVKSVGSTLFKGAKSIGSSLLGGLGGAIGGIPGALLGGAVDLGANWLTNEFIGQPNAEQAFENNLHASAQAFEKSKKLYSNRYQITMNDMRKAGLNPILAAGSGGFNVSGQPQMAKADSPMATMPQTSSAQSFQAMQGGVTEEVKRRKIVEEAANTYQDTIKKIEETALARAKTATERSKASEIMHRIKVLSEEVWVKISEFQKNIQGAYLAAGQQEKLQKDMAQVEALTKKIQLEMVELGQQAEIYKGFSGLLLKSVKEAIRAMSPFK